MERERDHENSNHNKARLAILLSYKVDFKARSID